MKPWISLISDRSFVLRKCNSGNLRFSDILELEKLLFLATGGLKGGLATMKSGALAVLGYRLHARNEYSFIPIAFLCEFLKESLLLIKALERFEFGFLFH